MLQKLKKLTIPRSPSAKKPYQRITPEIDPGLFIDLYRYCLQDVRVEQALNEATPDLSDFEQEVYLLDQEINERGVQIDSEALEDCIRVVEAAVAKYSARLCEIIGDPDVTVGQTERLREWVNAHEPGLNMASFDKGAVDYALSVIPEGRQAREVLQIRQALNSASIKKLYSMKRMMCKDGRIRGLFSYCGAGATGRWAGRGVQPQNMMNHGPAIKRVDEALEDFHSRGVNLADIEQKYGPALETVGSVLRGLFVGAPGHRFINSDFSAIEAVVLAFLAEEDWQQEVFRTHGLIYEQTASMITGTPLQGMLDYKEKNGEHHPDRKIGKLASLSSGYQGAVGAWIKFGADKFMGEEEILRYVKLWRSKNARIVALWRGLEKAASAAIKNPSMPFTYKLITYEVRKKVLYARPPSGRELTYHNPGFEEGKYGSQITFDGWNSDSTKGPVGWSRRYTYGGSLTENVCQAVARDILANSMLNLKRCGYPIVLHTHDEVTAEVPEGAGSVEQFESIMSLMPDWCKDWPIRAKGGWEGRRYRK